MRLSDWIDIGSLKVISHHSSATLGALIVYYVIGYLLDRSLPEHGLIKPFIEYLEQIVLGALFAWFAVQLAVLLWKKRVWRTNQNERFVGILVF